MADYLYRISNPNVERDHRFIMFTSSQPLRAARIHRIILDVLETSNRLRNPFAADLLDYLIHPRAPRSGDRFLSPYLDEIYNGRQQRSMARLHKGEVQIQSSVGCISSGA
jgi:hypothetical protein